MYTKQFNELSKKDVTVARGGGASLGEMTQLVIVISDGFAILTMLLKFFVRK